MYSSHVRSLVAAVALIACSGVVPAGAKQLVRQIPFSDWLAAQGINIVGWQEQTGPQVQPPVLGNVAFIDYAGGRAAALGLAFGFAGSGSVSVREQSDGTGLVTVNADFSNAITWARDVNAVPLFAYTPAQLAGDPSLTPGLSSGHLQAKYIVPDPDAPQLNLFVVAFQGGGTLQSLLFHSDGLGPLRAGFGVPEGTPGQCTVAQTAVLTTTGGGATGDAFPVEHVDVKLAGSALKTADPAASSLKSSSALTGQGSSNSHSWGAMKARYRDPKASD